MRKICLFAILSFVCAGAFAQNGVRVTPVVLEERDGKLVMELNVSPVHDEIRANDSYVITPELRGAANSKKFPDIIVNGSRRTKMFRRAEVLAGVRHDAGLVIDRANRRRTSPEIYRVTVPYERWMDKSTLVLNGDIGRCACRSDLFTNNTGVSPKFVLPEAYRVKPLLARMTPEVEQVKRRDIRSQAFLDFPAGRSEILLNFRNNPAELRKIRETLDAVNANKDVNITAIKVEGFASPEGSAAMNQRLSESRALALKNYIVKNYKIIADQITHSGAGEDWATLRTLVDESSIASRQGVLDIIDNSSDLDVKERQLRALPGGVFNMLMADFFPKLRRVDYKVDFNVRAYEEDEIGEVFANDPSMLSSYEMYLLAKKTDDATVRTKIFETMERLHADNPAVATNAIARAIEAGKPDEARRWIEIAGRSPEALNNIGVVYLMEGDYEAARGYLMQASALGSNEAKGNLQELEKKLENIRILKEYGK